MKRSVVARVARDPHEIVGAQRVRSQVFVREKQLLKPSSVTLDREADIHDELDTTIHFLACVDGAPVGTVRLIRPNPDVARALGQPIGIGLAARYDLGPFAAAGISLAEVSRLCILPEHRGTAVLSELYLAMYRESLRLGLTHWVAAANAETDDLEDAEIAYRVAERDGLVSARWQVVPWSGRVQGSPPALPLYSAAQRERARAGDLQGLRLPRTLATFARLAGRYMGRPIRERDYTVCSLPLVVDVADVVHTGLYGRAQAGF